MAVSLSPIGGAGWQFFDNNGAPLTGGKLYTYAAGTTTPQTTYTTSAGNVARTNPIVLNAAGRVSGSGEIWLTNGVFYKFVLQDANNVLIATYDNIAGINSVDAQDIPYLPPFTNSVETTVEDKLAQFVTPEDFGAVGDGIADDTAAMILAVNYINSVSNVSEFIIDRVYLIDFLALGANNRFDITRNDLTICGGGTIKVKPGPYSAGVASGAYKFYSCFFCTGNRVTVEGITFDGSNQFSQYLSSPSLPNYWWNAVYLVGTSTAVRTKNGRVVNCRYINGGGWPFRGQFHDYGLIDGCYVENSQGCGFDSGSLCVVSNNISYNAHDAHFATWNSVGATIVGNTCDTNDNGSGIDVSGSVDATIIGNTIRNCANRGIWVLQDPNTANPCRNIAIVGNTLTVNNTYVPISERGDIQIGPLDVTTDPRPVGTVDCRGLLISGNSILSEAGANAITLGKYAFYTIIEGNTFTYDAASPPNRSVSIWFSQNVIVRDNNDMIALLGGSGSSPKVLGNGPVWFDGVNVSIDTSATNPAALGNVIANYFVETTRRANTGKNYQIDQRYGYSTFGAEFNSANGSINVVDIGFTAGSFSVADIELIVTVAGDRGVRRTRVAYQGTNATTPTQIVAAADEYSGGSVPPTVTFTASTGKVRIAIGSNAILDASFWMRVSGTAGTVPNITPLV